MVEALRLKIAGLGNDQHHSASIPGIAKTLPPGVHTIAHYLLLPSQEREIAEWPLEFIQPAFKKRRITIGFSVSEAMHAGQVTIVGGRQCFPETITEQLQSNGCQVKWIEGTGMEIASQLATL